MHPGGIWYYYLLEKREIWSRILLFAFVISWERGLSYWSCPCLVKHVMCVSLSCASLECPHCCCTLLFVYNLYICINFSIWVSIPLALFLKSPSIFWSDKTQQFNPAGPQDNVTLDYSTFTWLLSSGVSLAAGCVVLEVVWLYIGYCFSLCDCSCVCVALSFQYQVWTGNGSVKKSMFIVFAYQGNASDCLYLVIVLILSHTGKKIHACHSKKEFQYWK